jgi:hypothetical protein
VTLLYKNNSTSKKFLLFCGILFVLLSGGAPFLHNHTADFAEHQDCPAHQIEAITVLLTFAIFILFVFLLAGNNRLFFSLLLLPVSEFIKSVFLYRAPPVLL